MASPFPSRPGIDPAPAPAPTPSAGPAQARPVPVAVEAGRRMGRLVLAVIIVAVLAAGAYGSWRFWRWSRFMGAVGALRAKSGIVAFDDDGPFNLAPQKRTATQVDLSPAGARGRITDADVATAAEIEDLDSLSLADCPRVSDEGLRPLARLTNLHELTLGNDDSASTAVTDAGLAYVKPIKSLRILSLHGCPITDAGLKHLAGMPNLELLDLSGTKVTDACVATLRTLPKLGSVILEQTAVTLPGARALKDAMPTLDIHHEAFEAELDGKGSPDGP